MLAVGTIAVGAAASLWPRDTPVRPPSIAVRMGSGSTADADRTLAMRGDRIELRATASQLWVFHGDEMIAACPSASCHRFFGGFALAWTAERIGRHRVLAAVGPTIASAPSFDATVLATRAAGATLRLAVIDVVAP